jgi:hypothetical protein
MKTPSDPDEENYGLGKPIRPIPKGEATEDEYEAVKTPHGTIWRNKRTQQLSTDRPTNWKDVAEAIKRMQQAQEEDGYPNVYWGVM